MPYWNFRNWPTGRLLQCLVPKTAERKKDPRGPPRDMNAYTSL